MTKTLRKQLPGPGRDHLKTDLCYITTHIKPGIYCENWSLDNRDGDMRELLSVGGQQQSMAWNEDKILSTDTAFLGRVAAF